MAHGGLWLFNMKMCCRMQISSLRVKLEDCKVSGWQAGHVVCPNYPAAPNEDYLFDCMNLYAKLLDDGAVEISGTVFYWNPIDGDTEKSIVIKTFPNLKECLKWIGNDDEACTDCVDTLAEYC